jgi:hypothetical protein
MRALAESLSDWDFPRTSNKLLELGLRIVEDTQPATIREVRTEILEWRNGLVKASAGPIMLDDLTGVLGQLRDLQHDLEG